METIEVELLTGQHNYAVVRLPARKFPGVVFQGDSLSILMSDARQLRDGLRNITSESDLKECQEQAEQIARQLNEIQSGYEAALQQHDIRLPYVK